MAASPRACCAAAAVGTAHVERGEPVEVVLADRPNAGLGHAQRAEHVLVEERLERLPRMSGQRLDTFFAEQVFGPLGMDDTAF